MRNLHLATKNATLSVDLSEAELNPYLKKMQTIYSGLQLSLAAIHGEREVVLAGGLGQLHDLQDLLREGSVPCHCVEQPIAYHSSLMERIVPQYMNSILPLKWPDDV